MSTFFQQTAQAMIAKHIDRFPLLKLDQVIDWQPIEQYLNRQSVRSRRICHSFAEILTLLKISAVPNKLQFRNENKSDDTVAFYFTNYIRPILHWFYQFYFFRPYKPIQVE